MLEGELSEMMVNKTRPSNNIKIIAQMSNWFPTTLSSQQLVSHVWRRPVLNVGAY